MNFRREATSGEEGVALFRQLRARYPDLPVILLTAWTHLETAVELVQDGRRRLHRQALGRRAPAHHRAQPARPARARAVKREALRGQRREARAALAERFDLRGIVYESEAMHTLVAMATQVAHADVPVLITGPNGAGKEVLADIVQANSARADSPYVKVNLGALPDELIEAELFGTEAGAFTGARARAGRFEAADGGTLFLDELGNLAGSGQAKLLRVLQTGEFERLGSNTTRRAHVRIIAATNTNLRARDPRRQLPRRSVLPPERHRARAAAARRAPRGHRCRWRGTSSQPRLRARRRDAADALRAPPLAGQRARAAEHHPPRLPALGRAPHRGGDPQPAAAAPLAAARSRCSTAPAVEQALGARRRRVAHAARDLGLSRQALYRRMEKLGLKRTCRARRRAPDGAVLARRAGGGGPGAGRGPRRRPHRRWPSAGCRRWAAALAACWRWRRWWRRAGTPRHRPVGAAWCARSATAS